MSYEQRAVVAWQSIEDKMRAFAPDLLTRLPAGATSSAIQKVENALNCRIPASALAVFLLHDGLGVPSVASGMCQASYLLSLSDALDAWRMLTELLNEGAFADSNVTDVSGPVRPAWWHGGWLPVTVDSAGNHYCIDLDPPPGGTPGQVVGFWHADGDRAVYAPDLATFLCQEIDPDLWESMLSGARQF